MRPEARRGLGKMCGYGGGCGGEARQCPEWSTGELPAGEARTRGQYQQ